MTTESPVIDWPDGSDLEDETYNYLVLLPEANRANLKYRATEGLLLKGDWVASELRPGELVARTCLIGAAAPLNLLNGPALNAVTNIIPKDWTYTTEQQWDDDVEGYVNGERHIDHLHTPPSIAYERFVSDASDRYGDATDDYNIDVTYSAGVARAQFHILNGISRFESEFGPISDPVLPEAVTN